MGGVTVLGRAVRELDQQRPGGGDPEPSDRVVEPLRGHEAAVAPGQHLPNLDRRPGASAQPLQLLVGPLLERFRPPRPAAVGAAEGEVAQVVSPAGDPAFPPGEDLDEERALDVGDAAARALGGRQHVLEDRDPVALDRDALGRRPERVAGGLDDGQAVVEEHDLAVGGDGDEAVRVELEAEQGPGPRPQLAPGWLGPGERGIDRSALLDHQALTEEPDFLEAAVGNALAGQPPLRRGGDRAPGPSAVARDRQGVLQRSDHAVQRRVEVDAVGPGRRIERRGERPPGQSEVLGMEDLSRRADQPGQPGSGGLGVVDPEARRQENRRPGPPAVGGPVDRVLRLADVAHDQAALLVEEHETAELVGVERVRWPGVVPPRRDRHLLPRAVEVEAGIGVAGGGAEPELARRRDREVVDPAGRVELGSEIRSARREVACGGGDREQGGGDLRGAVCHERLQEIRHPRPPRGSRRGRERSRSRAPRRRGRRSGRWGWRSTPDGGRAAASGLAAGSPCPRAAGEPLVPFQRPQRPTGRRPSSRLGSALLLRLRETNAISPPVTKPPMCAS